ncbi:uncharacterized protein LOC106089361 [Stomoxys calcitrans]|uniref:Uncharacterized protein n=1 Tax=Stomoxys calcitrans TaxID=35570 RepID=A0A1I8PEI2_STOCA|nr:uncharacterized protein LOC106089361 [Stomoxys calcitrans]
MSSIFLFLLLSASVCSAQFFYAQPSIMTQYHAGTTKTQNVAHPSVVENAAHESQLPPELRKSDRFYNNPQIAAGLAKESWFTDKEMQVVDREAEKIPREMVFKIFKNAGWIKRK